MVDSQQYLSVTALNHYINLKFEKDPYLKVVYVTGEISNYKDRKGHKYFSIKDDKSKISAVIWASDFRNVMFEPKDGMKVNIVGRVSTYTVGGNYQLYVTKIEPEGVGSLFLAFEQLKNKLNSAGYFNEAHKKPLPQYPNRIAVVTSESGSVIKDIITTVRRRFKIAQIVLFPAVVQGKAAANSIANQIKRVNSIGNFDTMIVGRGGGSIEDLWPFNEQPVIDAIYNSNIPIISSVGHETDNTIADLVADRRAATPTAAAELAVPDFASISKLINNNSEFLINNFSNYISSQKNLLNEIMNSYIFKQPQRLYEIYVQQLDTLVDQLNSSLYGQIEYKQKQLQNLIYQLNYQSPNSLIQNERNQLNLIEQQLQSKINNIINNKDYTFKRIVGNLNHLSPLQTMSRGYTFVSKNDYAVKKITDLNVNDQIDLTFIDGVAKAEIKQIINRELD